MERLTKIQALNMMVLLSAMTANHAMSATTEIKANIVDGQCQVSLDSANITFAVKNSYQFSTGTAEIKPLAVNINCENMAGLSPSLKITGESSGLVDTRLFRSASSSAQYVGFMLKKGLLTDLSDFYNAENTVGPSDIVAIDQDDGTSVQQFSIGLVRSANDPMFTNGTVNGKITFAFIFP